VGLGKFSFSRNGQGSVFAGLDGRHGKANQFTARQDAPEIVGGKFEDCGPSPLEILLVADILVASDEKVEFTVGFLNQIPIFDGMPTAFLGGGAIMAGEDFVHRPGDALVEQDPHAAENSADSERSKTSTAI
jgi:hypothetical protein